LSVRTKAQASARKNEKLRILDFRRLNMIGSFVQNLLVNAAIAT
jgi:hypothetical protein